MNISDIIPGRSYCHGVGKPRRVTAVEGDKVTYTVLGMRSLVPMSQSLPEFAAWAVYVMNEEA